MIQIGIDPVIIRLGALSLTWHSLFSLMGIVVGVWLPARLAAKAGLSPDTVYSMAIWAVPGGIVGARLVHVIDYWSYYAANPGAILAIWTGGIAIWGAIFGGSVGALVYARVNGIRLAPYADLIAPALILGQAIGRIGDIINGEHFSKLTDLPWGVVYTHPDSPAYGLPASHPEVAYELIMNLLIFAMLWALRKRIRREGNLFLIYLVSYSAGRFLLSFLRLDSNTVFLSLNQAQWISLLVLVVSLLPLLLLRRVHLV
ncbi:MAG: prolipoprotein diacylglyceryl transferase [Chloroflexi bacterium]|nr:prolipoprotein diacylglyceryl transferase [Chloroflexota bacterium]